MADVLIVQASATMFDTIEPPAWTVVFGVYVVRPDGTPVTGLTKRHFSVWRIDSVHAVDLALVMEVNADFPASKMPGVYRLQTKDVLGLEAPSEQGFVHAIRVSFTRSGREFTGITTTPVTYFGKPT